MTALRALVRKELAVLFGSPIAYLMLIVVAVVTALVFFEHLRLYNQILFLYATTTMGGFESDTIPDHINLRDTVFNPVMDQLSLLLILPIALVTMRVFAEERARGTEELLLTSGLRPGRIVLAKFIATLGFVVAMMAVSFVYPLTAIVQGGLGFEHLLAVFLGLTGLAIAIGAIGLACSASTASQILAAAATVALTFVLYDFGWTNSFVAEGVARVLDEIALRTHFARFAEGFVALVDLAYFAGCVFVAGAVARLSLELRRVSATGNAMLRGLLLIGFVALVSGLGQQRLQGELAAFSLVHLAVAGAALLAAGVVAARQLGGAPVRGERAGAGSAVLAVVAVAWGAGLSERAAEYTGLHWDLTFERRYELADATTTALRELGPALHITLYHDAQDPRTRRVRLLLDQMAGVAGASVDQRLLEDDLADVDLFGIGASDSVLLERGDRPPRGARSAVSGHGDYRWQLVERPTEGALYEALARLLESRAVRIYATVGTGEGDLERSSDPGYSGLAAALETEGYDLRPLPSAFIREVPADATALLLIAPERPLRAEALAAIRRYLDAGGRLMALLEPGRESGLEGLLGDYGLRSPPAVVVDPASADVEGAAPGLSPIAFNYADHPATRGLDRNRVTFFAGARSFELRKPQPGDRLRAVVTASSDSWLLDDVGALSRRRAPQRPPGVRSDYHPLVVVGEYRRDGARPTRIAAFGDADFASNRYLRSLYNLDLVLNTLHWLVERDSDITLRPKIASTIQFPVPIQNSLRAFYGVGLLIPEILLVVGGLIWLRRRGA